MTNQENLNMQEGSINFWIAANKVNFNDGNMVPLFQTNTKDGSIFILKDSDNCIKIFHIYIGKGRTDIVYDVSQLDSDNKHMITTTWSLSNKELCLYIDGNFMIKEAINY